MDKQERDEDALKQFARRLDRMDRKIISLFEKRMYIVKKATQYEKKHNIKPSKKCLDCDAVDMVTSGACDIEVMKYTERLMLNITDASKRYQRELIKKK